MPGPPTLASVPAAPDLVKRVVLGRALRSDKLGDTLLPKRIALPVFASAEPTRPQPMITMCTAGLSGAAPPEQRTAPTLHAEIWSGGAARAGPAYARLCACGP